MKFVYIHVFTLFLKKYRRSRNLLCHRVQTPDTRTTKIRSSKEISQKQSTPMAPEQATICVDSSSHVSKAARPALFTATIPKKPFKSKAATSDQTDSGKIPQKEKAILLHFSILKKRSRLRGEKQFANIPGRRATSLPSSCTRHGGRVGSQSTILTP